MSIYESLQLLAMVAVPLVAGGLGLIVYRIRSIQTGIQRNDERLDAHAERVAAIEAKMGGIVDINDDVKIVHRRVDEVLATAKQMEGQVAEIGRSNRLILEHLIRKEG